MIGASFRWWQPSLYLASALVTHLSGFFSKAILAYLGKYPNAGHCDLDYSQTFCCQAQTLTGKLKLLRSRGQNFYRRLRFGDFAQICQICKIYRKSRGVLSRGREFNSKIEVMGLRFQTLKGVLQSGTGVTGRLFPGKIELMKNQNVFFCIFVGFNVGLFSSLRFYHWTQTHIPQQSFKYLCSADLQV